MATSSTAVEPVATPDDPGPVFPAVGHAILTVTSGGTVTSYDEGARRLFGITAGTGPIEAADLFGPPLGTPGGVRALLDGFAAAPGLPPAWTGPLTCFDGAARPFAVTATAARDPGGPGGPDGLTVICGPPPGEPADRLAPDLSGRAGHELRGLMSGIAGLAAIMAKRAGTGGGTGDEPRRLRMIEQSARAGIVVVDRTVELFQLESGRIRCRPEPADLGRIIAGAIDAGTTAGGMPVRVHDVTGAAVVVRTDPALVRSIVAELISNALVAGAAGEVRVGARAGAGPALIEVTDDGRGITAEEQQTIFEPFVRGHALPDTATGLGLYLARRRAHLLGATLTVSSRPGQGSTFTLALPSPPAPRVPATGPPGRTGEHP